MKNAPLTLSSSVRVKRIVASLFATSTLFAFLLITACHKQDSVTAQATNSQAASATSTPSSDVAAAVPAQSPAAASPAPIGPSGPSPLTDQQGKKDQSGTADSQPAQGKIPPSKMIEGSDPKKVEEFMKSFKPTPTPPPAPTPKVEMVNGKIKQQWEAPAEFANLTNPVKDKPGILKMGREFYEERCEICHGKLGRGDGAWARNFSKVPTNLASKVVQANTDGELFYKVTNSRGPHPASKVRFTDEERWYLVAYLRTFK